MFNESNTARFARGCDFGPFLSRAAISDDLANSSDDIMRNRNSTPPKLQKMAPKNGGKAAMLGCRFFEFWGV